MLAVPHLIATKGSIVNVSSVNGMRSVSVVVISDVNSMRSVSVVVISSVNSMRSGPLWFYMLVRSRTTYAIIAYHH